MNGQRKLSYRGMVGGESGVESEEGRESLSFDCRSSIFVLAFCKESFREAILEFAHLLEASLYQKIIMLSMEYLESLCYQTKLGSAHPCAVKPIY